MKTSPNEPSTLSEKPLKNRSLNFDLIARPYRWLEHLSLGHALERCRLHFLPQLADCTQALVLGDGDGRFLARLLAQNSMLIANAVDISPVMIGLLRDRCEAEAPGSAIRLRTHLCDAMDFVADTPSMPYDLVVTHFFLDCLSQNAVELLTSSIAGKLAPNALWLVSDFSIPSGAMRLPAWIYVRSLYFAFRLITGLRVTRLPDHNYALKQAGFSNVASHQSLVGMLTTELWVKI